MTVFDAAQAKRYLDILLGADSSAVTFDFRAIHDTLRDVPAIPLRGTLSQRSAEIEAWNNAGYGVFVVVNETDGLGLSAANVSMVRAQFVDLDDKPGISVAANYQSAMTWAERGGLRPTMVVVSSPGRAHIYWRSERHGDVARFTEIQRKLISMFQGDVAIIDGPRVMRLPGSWHVKREPSQVTLYPNEPDSGAYGVAAFEWILATVTPSGGGAEIVALGDSSLAAPSFEWAVYALNRVDPNGLQREDWLKLTAAYKAAAWSHSSPETVRLIWDLWCAGYSGNDRAENDKLWRSIEKTKTGWSHLMRASGVEAEYRFGVDGSRGLAGMPARAPEAGQVVPLVAPGVPVPGMPPLLTGSPVLDPREQQTYFAGCYLIESIGRILTPRGRFMDVTKFNASYGGKQFILTNDGKSTDEPWRAATRGQIFQVPKVDGIRFIPTEPTGKVITDPIGRRAVNTYIPPNIECEPGDASPWLNHLKAILPTERDFWILASFLARNIQTPGRKAFWAPVIQSSEGAGKGVIKLVMKHALGDLYVHEPNAKELVESGGKFTGWMRSKLMIIADEIRVDEKRDMIEVLKPMITEERIEIQSKGIDQEMEDNIANWLMFTNWQDAIPIGSNDRRYSIFFSTIQSVGDLRDRGMDGDYFPKLYAWLRGPGKLYVTHWLRTIEIPAEFDPAGAAHRAPLTSSHEAALVQSYGRIEQLIADAVAEKAPGFMGGWISSVMLTKLLRENGIKPNPHAIKRAIENMNYYFIGRNQKAYLHEDLKRPNLYNLDKKTYVEDYAKLQGFE